MSDKYNKEDPSLLQQIQNKTGCMLFVIGFAMLAFVLTDLLGSGSSIFGSSSSNSVGEIAGENVSRSDYAKRYEALKAQVVQNNPGMRFDESMAQSYRDETWRLFVSERVIKPEYAALGINVSDDELEDITIGENTDPQLMRSFTNPETGQFDKNNLIQFLKVDIHNDDQKMASWLTFQGQLKEGLIAEKYKNLVTQSFYTTELEARFAAKQQGKTYNAEAVVLPYSELSDSSITVSDAEILSYARKSPKLYEKEESRDIEYVKIEVSPSAKDSAGMREWASDIAARFMTITDGSDSSFVENMNSDRPWDSRFLGRGSFPKSVENRLFDANKGDVIGPIQENGEYAVYKVTDVGSDSTMSVRGSHIQFNISGGDKEGALSLAQATLKKIKSNETSFEMEAQSRNFDASRSTGGDMGYLSSGNSAYPKEVVSKLLTMSNGAYATVTTERAVHIVKATSAPSNKTIQVAAVTQSIFPGTETDGGYYKQAGEIIAKTAGGVSFEDAAENLGLAKRVASKISEENRAIPGIGDALEISRWLFDAEREEGDVSNILQADGSYVVARVTKIHEKGMPTADELRDDLEVKVKNEKKAEILTEKMEEALKSATTAEALAKALGVPVAQLPAGNANSNIPAIGQDQSIAGAIAGTAVGSRSPIMRGENGVAVVFVKNENEYTPQNLEVQKMSTTMQRQQQLSQVAQQVLFDQAKVKDLRYKFYGN